MSSFNCQGDHLVHYTVSGNSLGVPYYNVEKRQEMLAYQRPIFVFMEEIREGAALSETSTLHISHLHP